MEFVNYTSTQKKRKLRHFGNILMSFLYMAVLPSSLMLLIPIAFSISAKEIRGRIGEGWRHSPQFQGLYGNPASVLVYNIIVQIKWR